MAITQYFKLRRVILLILSIVCAFSYQSAIAVTFTDGFESGDLSKSDNDFKWGGMGTNPIVDTTFAKEAGASLKFRFSASAPGGQAWSEQRFTLSGKHNDIWLKADIFIPSNYFCRAYINNKGPFYVWSGAYGVSASNVAVKFEHYCIDGNAILTFNPGGSGINYGPNSTCFQPCSRAQGIRFVDRAKDLNKWHEWIVHVRPATTSTSNDGLVEIWKNGQKLWYRYDHPYHSDVANYFDQGYIMGYANSGYDEETNIYFDNFVFSTEKINTQWKAPMAPSALVVE